MTMQYEFNEIEDITLAQTGDHANMVRLLTRHWDPVAIPDYRSALKSVTAQSDEDLLLSLMKDQQIAAEPALEDEDIVFGEGRFHNSEMEFFLTRPPVLHA